MDEQKKVKLDRSPQRGRDGGECARKQRVGDGGEQEGERGRDGLAVWEANLPN